MQITFSTDEKLKLKDVYEACDLSEKTFKTANDPTQVRATYTISRWIYKNIPDACNIIKSNGKFAGYTFILPCSRTNMDAFIKRKIGEQELCDKILQHALPKKVETLYACAAGIKPAYRRRGLATQGWTKSIHKLALDKGMKPVLFWWSYTPEG